MGQREATGPDCRHWSTHSFARGGKVRILDDRDALVRVDVVMFARLKEYDPLRTTRRLAPVERAYTNGDVDVRGLRTGHIRRVCVDRRASGARERSGGWVRSHLLCLVVLFGVAWIVFN